MKYDAGYYCCDKFVPKFKALLDARYSKLKEHKRRGEFEKEYLDMFQKNAEIDNISSSVKQWFARQQKPSIEKLMNICELLDCDIDYFLTEQEEFKKDTAHASETTGLQYETIEVLEKIKKAKKADNVNHIHKCILFVLDFLLQRTTGRWILWNMFQFFFKEYRFTRENNNSGSNAVELEADFIVPERNVSLFVDDISEGVFFSNITNGIAKIKVIEKTINFDTNAYEYLPSKEDILNNIKNIEDDISSNKEKEYKKYYPYTPKYALEYQHWEDTNKWEPRDNLAKEVESRVRLDIAREQQIEDLERIKESYILELQKLYPEN